MSIEQLLQNPKGLILRIDQILEPAQHTGVPAKQKCCTARSLIYLASCSSVSKALPSVFFHVPFYCGSSNLKYLDEIKELYKYVKL